MKGYNQLYYLDFLCIQMSMCNSIIRNQCFNDKDGGYSNV